ncbi:hypothetical protein A2215_04535 [Candidatus Berkelbacteria bacterium RIFOXYA2_FULL_43_10]|uniref:Uncharacterized protein n=1 Tax=Candidatus Berkelbacteria bacterium RIFOXYA2_FULL_43_10 TaxID=1797472 RepID=A0A1F5E3W0_9BACT|nr:MAG: hypothetical protein A2215_04535 [Candidatus Berkelbacteria bacterium RIFOXYA2_FULL_43_10]
MYDSRSFHRREEHNHSCLPAGQRSYPTIYTDRQSFINLNFINYYLFRISDFDIRIYDYKESYGKNYRN